jgi:2-keto-3-deoxy-L-rhamnonate aldolase RhmA
MYNTSLRLETMLITNSPAEAMFWEAAGVDIIFIDLEKNGKDARQHNVDSVKSHHEISDVSQVSAALEKSKTLVRLNPLSEGSESEIESVIESGADIIMLPMFETRGQVEEVLLQIDGRCAFYPLIETPAAIGIVKELSTIEGVSGFHFGLNDLHLALEKKFMFEVMLWPDLLSAFKHFSENDVFFGIGGVSKIGTGLLLSDIIIREYHRLGSRRVILSRGFKSEIESGQHAGIEIDKIQKLFASLLTADGERNRIEFVKRIGEICGHAS